MGRRARYTFGHCTVYKTEDILAVVPFSLLYSVMSFAVLH